VEQHVVDGELKTLLVHRKGSTRAFPPHHPLIPVDYQLTGQPVLIGGTMGAPRALGPLPDPTAAAAAAAPERALNTAGVTGTLAMPCRWRTSKCLFEALIAYIACIQPLQVVCCPCAVHPVCLPMKREHQRSPGRKQQTRHTG